jgi:hypothetical protein
LGGAKEQTDPYFHGKEKKNRKRKRNVEIVVLKLLSVFKLNLK